eukprot:tig00000788_g4078.t1
MKRKRDGDADSLDCAVCLEQLRQPSTLSCNHTFCRECILALPGVREAVGRGEEAPTACPLCRRQVRVPREVPVNPVIRDMLEQLAQAGRSSGAPEVPASEVVRGAAIGHGAMGMVFAGTWGGRPVALKVVDAAALGAVGEREAAARRLRREAAILSTVRHPGVVQFYGVVNEAGGGATLVMERAETSLRALLAERRLSLAECLDLGAQVLGALAHLHARNIVHRDVKPGNILVFRGEGGRLQYKLTDFGIAFAGASSTATAAVGTFAYAAPEALRGEGRADFAGDVYGAAVLLNEALAGRLPFPGVHLFQVMQRVTAGQRPESATEGVPAAVRALVQRMWAGEAAARPSAAEARRALEMATSGSPAPSAPCPNELREFSLRLWIGFEDSSTVFLYRKRVDCGRDCSVPNAWETFDKVLRNVRGLEFVGARDSSDRYHRAFYVRQLQQRRGVVRFRARTSDHGEWIDLTLPDPVVRLREGGTLVLEGTLEREEKLPRDATMQIYAKTVTVEDLKWKIQDKEGIPPGESALTV